MKKSLIFSLFAILFVACTRDGVEDVVVDAVVPDTIYATIETPSCRVQLNDRCETVWNKDDIIIVLSSNEYSLYRFNGKTGDYSGSFTKVGYGVAPGDKYRFDKSYAIYSQNSFEGYGSYSDGTPLLFASVQATQTYKKGSYGEHANIMFGGSEDGKNYQFTNILGYLRLSLTGNRKVSKITLSGNNNETIAGTLYFPTVDSSKHEWYSGQSSSIELDCGNGVALSTAPTSFYFALPPIIFNKGIKVSINFTDGTSYVQSTQKSIPIARNTIQPMKSFDTNPDSLDRREVVIYHSGEYIIAPTLDNAVTGEINWGDGNVSFFNEFTSYDFTDGAMSHIIKIDVAGATAVEFESCEGISKVDLSNFR